MPVWLRTKTGEKWQRSACTSSPRSSVSPARTCCPGCRTTGSTSVRRPRPSRRPWCGRCGRTSSPPRPPPRPRPNRRPPHPRRRLPASRPSLPSRLPRPRPRRHLLPRPPPSRPRRRAAEGPVQGRVRPLLRHPRRRQQPRPPLLLRRPLLRRPLLRHPSSRSRRRRARWSRNPRLRPRVTPIRRPAPAVPRGPVHLVRPRRTVRATTRSRRARACPGPVVRRVPATTRSRRARACPGRPTVVPPVPAGRVPAPPACPPAPTPA